VGQFVCSRDPHVPGIRCWGGLTACCSAAGGREHRAAAAVCRVPWQQRHGTRRHLTSLGHPLHCGRTAALSTALGEPSQVSSCRRSSTPSSQQPLSHESRSAEMRWTDGAVTSQLPAVPSLSCGASLAARDWTLLQGCAFDRESLEHDACWFVSGILLD
jgi:hypothetical protein